MSILFELQIRYDLAGDGAVACKHVAVVGAAAIVTFEKVDHYASSGGCGRRR